MGTYSGDYGSTIAKPQGRNKGIKQEQRARRHVEALERNRAYFESHHGICRPERDGSAPYAPSKHLAALGADAWVARPWLHRYDD